MIVSILVGIIALVNLIMFSLSLLALDGLDPATAPMPINQSGIIAITLSFDDIVIL